MKKRITSDERIMIAGLLSLAQRYGEKTRECERAMADIFNSSDEYGHWSDAVWDGISVDALLKRMDVTVED